MYPTGLQKEQYFVVVFASFRHLRQPFWQGSDVIYIANKHMVKSLNIIYKKHKKLYKYSNLNGPI